MCQGNIYCSLLGEDVKKWSKECPLPKPDFFEEALETFIEAFSSAVRGDLQSAISHLERIPEGKLKEWFTEHGQMSGWHHRVKILNRPKPPEYLGELDNPFISSNLLLSVFTRDSYHCRYCESRVINPKALAKFSKIVGADFFVDSGNSNLKRHGIALNFRATADHVIPIKRGGRTDIDNLVTSCWGCNYGKLNATLEQMGLDDPRSRAPINTKAWTGLWPITQNH